LNQSSINFLVKTYLLKSTIVEKIIIKASEIFSGINPYTRTTICIVQCTICVVHFFNPLLGGLLIFEQMATDTNPYDFLSKKKDMQNVLAHIILRFEYNELKFIAPPEYEHIQE